MYCMWLNSKYYYDIILIFIIRLVVYYVLLKILIVALHLADARARVTDVLYQTLSNTTL